MRHSRPEWSSQAYVSWWVPAPAPTPRCRRLSAPHRRRPGRAGVDGVDADEGVEQIQDRHARGRHGWSARRRSSPHSDTP